MATLFVRLFMAPSGAAQEKLQNHLSSLSFIIIITVVIVWWPKAALVLLSDILFLFGISSKSKGASLVDHTRWRCSTDDICDTLSFFKKKNEWIVAQFIQNWHLQLQSGAVSFVCGRVRLQMMMLSRSDCWLFHPIEGPMIDDDPSTCSAGWNLRHRCPLLPKVAPQNLTVFILHGVHSFGGSDSSKFAMHTKWRRISFIRNGKRPLLWLCCCDWTPVSTFFRPSAPRYPSAAWLDWYIFDTDGSNRFRWLPTNRIKMFKRTFFQQGLR